MTGYSYWLDIDWMLILMDIDISRILSSNGYDQQRFSVKEAALFYIRADGNEKIGMGHVMRCLAIAEALRKEGEEVLFLAADHKPAGVIQDKGFPVKILDTCYEDMETELPELTSVIQKKPGNGEYGRIFEKSKILVDSYFITESYLKALQTFATVILMDDEKKAVYPCDALVNYNIYGNTLSYKQDYPAGVKLFLGCAYMPLREQFGDVEYVVRDRAAHILLTTGGGDSCHMALAMAKYLSEKLDWLPKESNSREKQKNMLAEGGGRMALTAGIWHIVCGPYCTDTEELESLAEQNSFLKIHKNVTDMSELMQRCDVAVSAAGSTLYELCRVGVPTVGFYFAENQRQNMEAFERLSPIKNAGDFSAFPDRVLSNIVWEAENLCRSRKRREEVSLSMRTFIDGRGAERLSKGLLEL